MFLLSNLSGALLYCGGYHSQFYQVSDQSNEVTNFYRQFENIFSKVAMIDFSTKKLTLVICDVFIALSEFKLRDCENHTRTIGGGGAAHPHCG